MGNIPLMVLYYVRFGFSQLGKPSRLRGPNQVVAGYWISTLGRWSFRLRLVSITRPNMMWLLPTVNVSMTLL
jgi:hypothetical protein